MRTTIYAFPSDLLDEGVAPFLAALRQMGVDAAALAVNYHRARDFCPRRSNGRLVYRDDGLFLMPHDDDWYDVRLRPPIQPEPERVAVGQFLQVAPAGSLAWTVFLHNTSLGRANPDLVTRTAFGDPVSSNLCPAQPAVARYAVALARTVARTGLPIAAEALSFLPFGHGEHHERYFVALGEGDHALLSLCFCAACRTAAETLGVDVERLTANVRRHVDAVATERTTPLPGDLAALVDTVGPDLIGMFKARATTVARLVSQVQTEIANLNGRIAFVDLTGAALGYDDGHPSGAPAAEQAWLLGIDPQRIASLVAEYAVLVYAADVERFRQDVDSYAQPLAGQAPLRVILRPGPPDVLEAGNLTAKLRICATAGVSAVDFYNYGMASQASLDRVRSALAAVGG